MGWEVHKENGIEKGLEWLTHAATTADRRVWQAPASTYLRPEPRARHPRPAKSRMLKPARGAPAAAARRTGAIPGVRPPPPPLAHRCRQRVMRPPLSPGRPALRSQLRGAQDPGRAAALAAQPKPARPGPARAPRSGRPLPQPGAAGGAAPGPACSPAGRPAACPAPGSQPLPAPGPGPLQPLPVPALRPRPPGHAARPRRRPPRTWRR